MSIGTSAIGALWGVHTNLFLSREPDFFMFVFSGFLPCRKFDHITPSLRALHWLPVHSRIQFKILLIVFKCLNGLAAKYLETLLQQYCPRRELRSSGLNLLMVRRANLKGYGDRAFSIAGPKLWNALPEYVKSCQSVQTFKSKLKHHLFSKAYK